MRQSSHRLKTAEQRLIRKLLLTVGSIFAVMIFIIYIGLPIFAKFIVAITSLRKDRVPTEETENIFLSTPILAQLPEATNSAKIDISGFSEKELTVKILINDKETAKVLSDSEGKFLVNNISLSEGENIIKAQVLKDDQESQFSDPILITFKKSLPKLEIISPTEGQKFSGEEKEIVIKGETDPGNRVTINDRVVIVNQQGIFTLTTNLSDGENVFKIVAADDARNETTVERKVTYNP